MTLIKTTILSSIATIIRVINGFIIVKIISVYVGPSGLAYVSQFQNFLSIVTSFSVGIIKTGVVKYTAEHSDNTNEQQKVWSTALRISLLITSFISLLIIVFHNYLSVLFFNTSEYGSIFIIFALTLFLFVLNAFLLAVLNGKKEIRKLTIVSIVSSFVGLLLTGWLSYIYGLYGALLSYAIGQSLVFFVTLSFVIKSKWFKIKFFLDKLDKVYLKKLGAFALMAIISGLAVPLSSMIVRNYIGETISWDNAGYWDAISKISSTYLMFVTTTLSIYYMPRLAELKSNLEIKKEIFYGYKIILPLVAIASICIYYLKDIIILVLFTEQFMPMRELFFYQLLGDFFKIAGLLLGYLMLAKAMTKLFIITQVLTSISFAILSILLINEYSLVGVTIAFAINNFLFFIVMIYVFRKILRSKNE